MQYFGGKARIAKPLAEYLNSQLKEGQPFVDLFCGSCNVVSKIDTNRIRIANDLHYELISLLKSAQNGDFKPVRISEEEYKAIKKDQNENYPAWFRGFVGFGLSFSGKWFKGFARNSRGDDYFSNAVNSIRKKSEKLLGVEFSNNSYKDVVLPENSVLYCDIPYKNSIRYSVGDFNHEEFYKWAEQKQLEGFTVLVSEYGKNVPEGWEIVWQHNSKKNIRNSEGVQEATVEVLMTPSVTNPREK